jgi:protein-disulfide isomerase
VKRKVLFACIFEEISMKNVFASVIALLTLSSCVTAQQTGAPATQQPPATNGALHKRTDPGFPPVNPANFTATTPTVDEVNAFLKAMWGYDENRVWTVAAVLATPAPGVSKVVVYIADKNQPGKQSLTTFFSLPDGKHVIADNVVPFGAKPFAEIRTALQTRANGPSRGAKSNDLMLVEFGDLQCPKCRDAQATMDNLAQDFPQARIVFQDFPLTEAHPFAEQAAEEGVCVRKTKGDAAFFTYAAAVYTSQSGLTKESSAATLAAAAAKAGADPSSIASCMQSAETKEAVSASVKLGREIGVTETPMLAINGRLIPLNAVSYDVLKRIIVFQANQDGIALTEQPSLHQLK